VSRLVHRMPDKSWRRKTRSLRRLSTPWCLAQKDVYKYVTVLVPVKVRPQAQAVVEGHVGGSLCVCVFGRAFTATSR
jgi:hypothetical protein